MPKKAKELSALEVKRLQKPGMHAVGGVAGLHLQVLPSGGRTWILKVVIGEKRREMGLGGYPDVTLEGARTKAREVRETIAKGIDPIAERAAARSALVASKGANIVFSMAATQFVATKSAEWKSLKHVAQWTTTLETYAYPIIGSVLVRDVTLAHIIRILEPIWTTKTETASRLRGRIESVLDWATVRGYRHGENPARWHGHLDKLLPKPGKVAKVEHHTALPVSQMGAFIRDLRIRDGIAARALEFLILTATRSSETRGAKWEEIDLNSGVWTIPANRMKAGKEHRVPLSSRALELLHTLRSSGEGELVFPAPRGGVLSDMTLTAVMRRMEVDAVPHGFRSTFRDWASEYTNYPREVAEMALAHTISDKVEAAYRRGDLFEKRRKMAEDWARFCTTVINPGEVVPLRSNSVA